MKLDKKLMKRIDEVAKTQKYDEKLVLTLLEMSNVARRLAERMLLMKYKQDNAKQ